MSYRTPTILVIDNDDALSIAISHRLEHYGYECVRAASGAQGLAAFKNNEIDLIITDLNMPAGNGVALATSIRQLSGVPIIVVTGFRDEFRREIRSIENVAVIEKPFNPEQLLELVEMELVLSGCALPSRSK